MRTPVGSGAARAVLIGVVLVVLLILGAIAAAVAALGAPGPGEKTCVPGFTIGATGCSARSGAAMLAVETGTAPGGKGSARA